MSENRLSRLAAYTPAERVALFVAGMGVGMASLVLYAAAVMLLLRGTH